MFCECDPYRAIPENFWTVDQNNQNNIDNASIVAAIVSSGMCFILSISEATLLIIWSNEIKLLSILCLAIAVSWIIAMAHYLLTRKGNGIASYGSLGSCTIGAIIAFANGNDDLGFFLGIALYVSFSVPKIVRYSSFLLALLAIALGSHPPIDTGWRRIFLSPHWIITSVTQFVSPVVFCMLSYLIHKTIKVLTSNGISSAKMYPYLETNTADGVMIVTGNEDGLKFVDDRDSSIDKSNGAEKSFRNKQPLTYIMGPMLAQGAFASVHLGLIPNTGRLVAIKRIHKHKVKDYNAIAREVESLKTLRHPHIVGYLGTDQSDTTAFCILLEYVAGGSLAHLYTQFGAFPEPLIKHFTRQILVGLVFLHSQNIVHGDIKGRNILVSDMGFVKLADFGAIRRMCETNSESSGTSSLEATILWMAPELCREITINDQGKICTRNSIEQCSDVWSLGCTLIEMATGRPPWSELNLDANDMMAAIYHIAQSSEGPLYPPDISTEFVEFLEVCMHYEISRRYTCDQLQGLPFVSSLSARYSYASLAEQVAVHNTIKLKHTRSFSTLTVSSTSSPPTSSRRMSQAPSPHNAKSVRIKRDSDAKDDRSARSTPRSFRSNSTLTSSRKPETSRRSYVRIPRPTNQINQVEEPPTPSMLEDVDIVRAVSETYSAAGSDK